LNKRILAIAITTIMLLGLIPTLNLPVARAQSTTWTCTAYHSDPLCVFLHPGVSDAWKVGWGLTLDTLWNATTGDAGQKKQIFDKLNDFAILTSTPDSDSIGDLQFDIQVLSPETHPTVAGILVYVPPEFKFLSDKYESVWTDITNDYEFIYMYTANAYDSVAPGWTVIQIGGDNGPNNGFSSIPMGTYHLRLFNLRAPEAAGLYHFKMAYVSDWGVGTAYLLNPGNYPIIIAKSELNPAYVEVTVRTAANTARPYVSGRVLAEGTTPEGRSVSGIVYWGPMEFVGNSPTAGQSGAMYRMYLFGLAAGTYTLTAEGSGFSKTITDRIALSPGQSYSKFIVIFKSPNIAVTVWSKHGTGAIPWNNLWQLPYGTNNPDAAANDTAPWRDILLDLYDSSGNLVAWWGSNVFGSDHYLPINTMSGGVAIPANPRHSPAAFHGVYNKFYGSITGLAASNILVGLHDEEAPHPTKTSFYALLQDNSDPYVSSQFYVRNYPSTHWDGHVPWVGADYVAGFDAGAQYTIEAFVTGYIMDEADAYQRTFNIPSTLDTFHTIQFDLRRSNWVETVMHLPNLTFLSAPTSVTLTALDVGGNERAAIAFRATNAMSLDGMLDGADASSVYNDKYNKGATDYTGGIVIEGWNAVFPNLYGSMSRDPIRKDYGLNPTASTHTQGTVPLAGNPYTLKLYMADMGYPWAPPRDSNGYPRWNATGWYNIVPPDPQVSVFLCNSPQLLSFSVVNAKLWLSIRSVDFEIPAHSRPWIFPGSEVKVEFLDSAGSVVDTLDPLIYGLVQDPGMWIHNETAAGGNTETYQQASTSWKADHNKATGWQITGIAHDSTAVLTGYPVPKTGFSAGVTPYDIDNVNAPGLHEHLGVWYFGTDYTSGAATLFGRSIYRALLDLRPTRLPAGEYNFAIHTHGYVLRRAFPVQVPFTGQADIEADLIEGGQIRTCMAFYHEGITTAFHGWVRVEVFNANGDLVGASIYGQAEPNIFKRQTIPAGYGTYLAYDSGGDHMIVPGPAQAAGMGYTAGNWTLPSDSGPQRAYVSNYFYSTPMTTWASWGAMKSTDNRLGMAAGDYACYDVYGFYNYYGGKARTWAGGWPTTNGYGSAQYDSGLPGSVDIPGWSGSGAGLYSVKVWAFDPMGPNGYFEHSGATDDWRMYSMAYELSNIEVPWEGAANVWINMNDMAKLRGTVRWFDMYGNLRPLPWAQISATDSADGTSAYATGNGAMGSGASDSAGAYIMWLPAGTHDVSVSTSLAPGIWSSAAPTMNAAFSAVVSDGWVGGGDSQLSASGTPVPELPSFAAPLAMFAILAASVWLLRKKTLNAPLLMK